MSDHQNYCNIFPKEISISMQHDEDFSDDPESITCIERSGDDFLIELYRERAFLYDKGNPNFKDTAMKQNAWEEISRTMIETNCGEYYTPEYCQRKCTSLREQYNREKKKIENQSRSGSAALNSKSRHFPLYPKLKFLDQVIKRQRTYSNVKQSQSDATLAERSVLRNKTCISNNVDVCSSNNKENEDINNRETVDMEKSHPDVCPKYVSNRKRKMDETKELEQTFLNMSSRIMNYMETSKPPTADDAFIEFVKLQLDSMSEQEKNIRRKMIMDAISAPLPKM